MSRHICGSSNDSYICLAALHSPPPTPPHPMLRWSVVGRRSLSRPGVIALSGSCLASCGGPRSQMACQDAVTEVHCLSHCQPSRPPVSPVQLGGFWPHFKSPTHLLSTDSVTPLCPEMNSPDALNELRSL